MSDKGNELDMLTAQQVHDLTGVPISTLHDWASKRERGIEAPGPHHLRSAIVTAVGRDAMLLHGSTRRGSNPMTTHEVACRIDDNEVEHWDNEKHPLMWHVAQANPADGFRDSGPGELVERIGREIIRHWLRDILSSSTTTKAATTTGKTCCSLGNWNTDGEFIPDERAMLAVVPQHERLT